ncbi:hypothetical protein [Xanthomonas phage NEB7]|nr:hypothetical protein [Xanthomonas phage NEB7]
MSTIIILTPPIRPRRVAATATGAAILDHKDATLAQFSSVADAQAYLQSIEALESQADTE